FYVGDANGFPAHSDVDIEFARAVGLPFYLPEAAFAVSTWAPLVAARASLQAQPAAAPVEAAAPEAAPEEAAQPKAAEVIVLE
ncbi:hypothetical protein, partial [Salmonella enterica]|uniref:hypothetical protein n=1 Tax=Salmonella enterica TaxID=28901 RepID=UPI0035262E0F